MCFHYLDDMYFKILGLRLQLDVNNNNTESMLQEVKKMNGISSFLKFWKSYINIPEIFDILPVKRGGTGTNYFSPNKILFGNGIDPIKTSSELMFHNNQLILGDNSNILLQNTSNNTLTSFGGATFKTMYINSCEITPNPNDFISEQTFIASHNILIPVDITNFVFNTLTRCFTGVVSVCIITSISEFVEIIDLKCYQKSVDLNKFLKSDSFNLS